MAQITVTVHAREVMAPDIAPATPQGTDPEGQVTVGGVIIRGHAVALRNLAEALVDAADLADRADREN
jgi:hypothetical protein